MKKLFISAALLCAGLLCHAQLLNVAGISRVALPDNVKVNIPVMSPDGQFVVVSSLLDSSLRKVSVSNGSTQTITDNGSALDLRITPDGRNVVYRCSTVDKNRLRHTSLMSTDLNSLKSTTIVKPTRHMGGFEIAGAATVNAIESGRLKSKTLRGTSVNAKAVASINRGHLDVTVGGKTTTIDPQGRGSYLWPSVSPDGTRVAYYLVTGGCFVCNLDGSNAVQVGDVLAPKWLDNNVLVGYQCTDNGEVLTSATVVAATADGTIQKLTDSSLVLTNPSPSANGKSIACSTPDGQLYIISIK